MAITQQTDRSETALIRTLVLGDPLECSGRRAMQTDFDPVRRQSCKSIGFDFFNQRPVREDSDEKAAPNGLFINHKKIGPAHRFTAGQAQFQCAGSAHVVHDSKNLGGGELLTNELRSIAAIRVTHDTVKIATTGDLPLAGEWEAVGEGAKLTQWDHRLR